MYIYRGRGVREISYKKLRLCSRLSKSRLLPQTLRQTLAPSAGEVGEVPRGSTAKHGPRKPSMRDCAGFWRAAMAWSVCGGGARHPWSRKKTLALNFFGQPSKTERSTEKRRGKPRMRTENARLLLQSLAIRRQTLALKRGSGCNIFMKSPEPPCVEAQEQSPYI